MIKSRCTSTLERCKDYVMEKLILTIDVGTSSSKAALYDQKLTLIASEKREYGTDYPARGWAEHSAEEWWEAFKKSCHALITKNGIDPEKISVIGIDAMSTTLVAVDSDGVPLRPAMIWLDRRAEEQCSQLEARAGDKVVTLGGNRADPSFFAAKAMWIKDNEPEIYKKTAQFLHCNGYMVHKLTGKFSMDITQCGLSNLCDTATGEWSDELLEAARLDREKFPPIFECSHIVGTLLPGSAAETGLVPGIPVVAGSMDNPAAVLGLGVIGVGETYISAGTATNVGTSIDKPMKRGDLLLYHHGIKDRWLINGGVDFGGSGLRWFRDILNVDYTELDQLALETEGSAVPLVFLPYMIGQRAPLWDNDTRGVFFGLSPDMGRKEFVRAIMESTVFGCRRIFNMIEEEMEKPIQAVALTGGCARNNQWNQLFADITEKEILPTGLEDAAPLGTAIIAGLGAGIFSSPVEALALCPESVIFKPDISQKEYYDDMFFLFSQLYDSLTESYKRLGALTRKYDKKSTR
jgi:sugar (pentulose or hexulose) kinase